MRRLNGRASLIPICVVADDRGGLEADDFIKGHALPLDHVVVDSHGDAVAPRLEVVGDPLPLNGREPRVRGQDEVDDPSAVVGSRRAVSTPRAVRQDVINIGQDALEGRAVGGGRICGGFTLSLVPCGIGGRSLSAAFCRRGLLFFL